MSAHIIVGDALETLRRLPDGMAHCCVTSPPYFGLRDYGVAGQIGLEATPEAFVAELVAVFREVRRVLRDDGTLWLNLGDSYAGSGKGGNPDAGKQATNRGSQSIGVLYGKTGETARQAAVANVTRKTREIGAKAKDLLMIPARVALALQADGWYLRSDIIWHKPNPMPESVTDRPTSAHEHIFLLAKSERYFYDADAVKEACQSGPSDIRKMEESKPRIGGKHKHLDDPLSKANAATNIGQKRSVGDPSGRNLRNVWKVATSPYRGAHFATFPPALIEPCIKAGCPVGGTVLDPFFGAGTTALVAAKHGRSCIGIELNPADAEMAAKRLGSDVKIHRPTTERTARGEAA